MLLTSFGLHWFDLHLAEWHRVRIAVPVIPHNSFRTIGLAVIAVEIALMTVAIPPAAAEQLCTVAAGRCVVVSVDGGKRPPVVIVQRVSWTNQYIRITTRCGNKHDMSRVNIWMVQRDSLNLLQ